MLTRRLLPPEDSFFLLGARGTGKTTWIQQHFANAPHYDLLLSSVARWNIGLDKLREMQPKGVRATFGVYAGTRPMVQGKTTVLPWRQFLARLWDGTLFD